MGPSAARLACVTGRLHSALKWVAGKTFGDMLIWGMYWSCCVLSLLKQRLHTILILVLHVLY